LQVARQVTDHGEPPELGVFKVIHSTGAKVRSSSDEDDSKEIGILELGTSVRVDYVKMKDVSAPQASLVSASGAKWRWVGWVDLVALERLVTPSASKVASAASKEDLDAFRAYQASKGCAPSKSGGAA